MEAVLGQERSLDNDEKSKLTSNKAIVWITSLNLHSSGFIQALDIEKKKAELLATSDCSALGIISSFR